MKTLAIVPARAGSKGIKNKNHRPFCGRPLAAWAVDVGLATCDRTYISSDDPELEDPTIRGAAGFWARPPDLAKDTTPMLDVIQHAMKHRFWFKPKYIVLLQPTQPLRRPEHVAQALDILVRTGADSVVSVVEIPAHYSPDYAMATDGEKLRLFLTSRQVTRRQDCRRAYSRDGTVYAIKRETIEAGSLYGQDCRALFVPRDQSANIDTEEDWARAESLMRERNYA